MSVKKSELSWIQVDDLKKSKAFFSEVLGLKVTEEREEFGWVELCGAEGGQILGLAQKQEASENSPATIRENAIVTFTVDDMDGTMKKLQDNGVEFIGEVIEIPNELKMALFKDRDGNHFQLVEKFCGSLLKMAHI